MTQRNVVAMKHVTTDAITGSLNLVIPIAIYLVTQQIHAAVTRVATPAVAGFKEHHEAFPLKVGCLCCVVDIPFSFKRY